MKIKKHKLILKKKAKQIIVKI